jgi:lipopolysaccharide export system protein LptC
MSLLQISYSNAVFYLKLSLFFMGLFAIVLIFLSAKKFEPSTEIPFAKDINFATLDDGLTQPLYSSITNSGDELQIAADQIISTNQRDTALIKSANLKIFSDNGNSIFLSSDTAILNKKRKNLIFKKNVNLTKDKKIKITAPEISTALDKTLIQANGPVRGLLVNSNIQAGQLNIFRENISGKLVISFTKGVKMVYSAY